eukprot:2910584-Amphidinium_carterae.1
MRRPCESALPRIIVEHAKALKLLAVHSDALAMLAHVLAAVQSRGQDNKGKGGSKGGGGGGGGGRVEEDPALMAVGCVSVEAL